MTKKDYIVIAKVLGVYGKALKNNEEQLGSHYKVTGSALVREIVYKLAEVLKADNPRFDEERFAIACNVK